MKHLTKLVLLVAMLGACASEESIPAESGSFVLLDDVTHAPAERFDALERDLLAARAVEVVFSIKGEGAITTDLSGSLRTQPDGSMQLDVQGEFGGEPVDLALDCGPQEGLRLRDARGTSTFARPPALEEAVLLGLTRMGLLHNIARLSGRLTPEGCSGGFRKAACCLCFENGPGDGIGFKVFWVGDHVADAELRFGPKGRPVQRSQTVHFPEGDMRVVESYDVFEVQMAADS